MSTSALFRALNIISARSSASRLMVGYHLHPLSDSSHLYVRQYSILNEFSKHLKGEAKGDAEFQQSVKELGDKISVVKEDLKVRTKSTAEKLYKSVDGVLTEAEATSRKVSANMKEKISAAQEEVKEGIRVGKEQASGLKDGIKDAFSMHGGSSYSSSSQHSRDSSSKESPPLLNDTTFSRLKSTVLSFSPMFSNAFEKLKEAKVSNLAKKGYDVIRDELRSNHSKRKHIQHTPPTSTKGPKSTRTELVIVPTKKSPLNEKWEAFKKKMKDHPLFKRVSGYTEPIVNKGQEVAEDLRERWETSDNPVVHKIQDLNESVFGENATALSLKEIRRRDPNFSLPDFVAEVQEMIRPVLTSYNKGDVETLKKFCTSELIERCKGERSAYQAQGIFFDHKILHISEVEVRETKMFGTSPIIILIFQTQQIYCARDREGRVTIGGEDTIQNVINAWAMQLLDGEELGEEIYFPVWRLREMQQLGGMQALI